MKSSFMMRFFVVFSSTACVLYTIVINEANMYFQLPSLLPFVRIRVRFIEGVTRLTIAQF